MDTNAVAKDAPWRVLFGLLYGFILFFLSLLAAGAPEGGGIAIPLLVSAAPLSAMASIDSTLYNTPLLWAALAYSTALPFRAIPQALFVLHYLSSVAVVIASMRYASSVNAGPWALVWAAVYLGGQVMFWRAIKGRA